MGLHHTLPSEPQSYYRRWVLQLWSGHPIPLTLILLKTFGPLYRRRWTGDILLLSHLLNRDWLRSGTMYLCKSISGYYLILCKRGCNQCWIMMGVLWIIDFICNLSGMASWLTLVFGTCNNHFTPNIYKHHYKTLNTMYKI